MQNKDKFDAALKQLTFNTSEHQYEFQRVYVSFLPVFITALSNHLKDLL